jgi:protoporphyrin/coproporphyrin ferrochelatase
MKKIAVVLFNLGAPDRPDAVQPFLFNLFNDPAIIGVPQPMRWLLAKFVSKRRAKTAQGIYDRLGGGSPLLPNTQAQAQALQIALADLGTILVIPAMRYWHPLSAEVADRLRGFAPDEIILLPLYPQYSTTTTDSSLRDWQKAAQAAGLHMPSRALCCYPAEAGFIRALASLVQPVYARTKEAYPAKKPRVLFSAHGIPKRLVERGDPYQAQVELTVAATVKALSIPDLDWQICYQSRVGPLEWIGPYAEAEIARAGAEGIPLVVVPVAFVSEHSETLVELDETYRADALAHGVPLYERVGTVGTHPDFIAGLARLVRDALAQPRPVMSDGNVRHCPAAFGRCALSSVSHA